MYCVHLYVGKTSLPLFVINNYVMGFDISVHDSLAMAVVQRLQKRCQLVRNNDETLVGGDLENLVDVVANIVVIQSRVQSLKVRVVHVLEDLGTRRINQRMKHKMGHSSTSAYEARSSRLRIFDDVKEFHNVGASTQILQDFNFSLNFLLLDRLEDLDDTLLSIADIYALKDLAVFATTNLPDYLIVFGCVPLYRKVLIVPVLSWSLNIDVGVQPRESYGYPRWRRGRRRHYLQSLP